MEKLMRNNRVLWVLQGLLAALFLFAGGAKLAMPADQLTAQAPQLSVGFLRFIATMELLGAVGLILPWLLGIHRYLTPLAAAGLVVIMIGATVISVMWMGVGSAIFPFVVGILCLIVARGRREQASPQLARTA